MKRKHLINQLFIINSLTLFLGFCLIFFSVNQVARRYVQQMTANAIQGNFTIIDSIYEHKPIPDNQVAKKDSIYVWANYAIYDKDYQLKYTNSDQKKISDAIVSYLNRHHLWSQASPRNGLFVPWKGKTYYVMVKDYHGKLEDDFIFKAKNGKSQPFHVINFSDITNTQKLIDQINLFLFLILIIIFFCMFLIMQRTFKGIQKSIHSVQHYISHLWRENNQKSTQKERIIFSDFDPLLQESKEMAERIRQAEKSQLTFFQNASHELRTPLMSIQGYTEGLQAGILDESSAYQIILEESQKMKTLVDDIMLLSRLDSKKQAHKQAVSLYDVLQESVSYIKPVIMQKDLQLIQDYDDFQLMITGNSDLLEKAISNILSNALRYAENYIIIRACDHHIIIANDGPPIAEKDLPYIFDRFYKGEKGQTGIGLSLVKEIVQQHQGKVKVTSHPEETQFIISF
ncbi:sensor histidine kinase [Streptococcus uberis]|uniref:sensor histidine kinase n=1 Tax=Streptococcus uberis TaxID=1349 RepID=UPI00193A5F5A|nr:HAMP domain-containing sensor histidine kinase [Streptococcus uberis]